MAYEDRGKGIMIAEALKKLAPGTQWNVRDETIEWNDSSKTQPTQSEIDAQIATNKADWDSKEYQRVRAPQYPSLQEQLDLQYWDQVNGTTKWKEAIAQVKSDNPKP